MQRLRPLHELTAEQAAGVDYFVFDLDDTVLDHGKLREEAYAGLHRAREAGLTLVACTGRPAGWAEIVARQWPVAAAIAENGAVAWSSGERGVQLEDTVEDAERRTRRARLAQVVYALRSEHPSLSLADDNAARLTDCTFDIGEHRRESQEVIARARALAHQLGARTFLSSIHLHLTFEGHDKASGFCAWACRRGADATRVLRASAFAGDSPNDAAAFGAFGLTFGVRNVRAYLPALSTPPRFLAEAEMGLGFAQICSALASLRGQGSNAPAVGAAHAQDSGLLSK